MKRITINGEDVVVKESPVGKVRYEYFSCSCDEKDMLFWEDAVEEITEVQDRRYAMSALTIELEQLHDTYVTSIYSDMWFGVTLQSEDSEFYIQTDVIEHALVTTILILRELNK